ncbi:protein kinase [Nonomuraea sp. NBC_01738]|uniref:protein kinase domain-containing protein n=1 Tax=Nonomuraea sp. NBC_01738 TaxID=2976003 RepID=UPI002E10BA81|nr:protein kinase [Nonomuraea sp. NBC_01738]
MTVGDLGRHIPGYQLIEAVGQGGFAVVYRALHERVGRVVAVKVLSVTDLDERAVRNFRRELEVTSRLSDHPNIVAALDTGTAPGGRPYIVMDFYEAGSLYSRLRGSGALPVADTLRIGVKVAAALAAVHEAGVFHGDIKPQNILMSKYGEPALADFGVARMLDVGQLSSNTLTLTPHHAAPEVLNGSPQSVRSDVYALGSTLYQLLAGRPAYHDPGDVGIAPMLVRVLRQPPPPLARADVPPGLRGLIERAMSKQPGERPADAWAFARELQEVQRGLGLPVTEPATVTAPPLLCPHACAAFGHAGCTAPSGRVPFGRRSAPVRCGFPAWGGCFAVRRRRGGERDAHAGGGAARGAGVGCRRRRHRGRGGGGGRRGHSDAGEAEPVTTAGEVALAERVTGTPEPSAGPATEPPSPSASAKNATLAKVTLSAGDAEPEPGRTFQLKLTGRLSDGRSANLGRATIQYHTADPRVATVSPDGQVTVLTEGKVRITAKVTIGGSSRVAALPLSIGGDATPSPTTTVSAEPPKDRRVPVTLTNMVRSGSYSGDSYPACEKCKVKAGNPGYYRETYFRFNLSAVKVKPARVSSIVLYTWMHIDDHQGVEARAAAYGMGNDWTSGVTFDTRPQLGNKIGEFPSVTDKGTWVKLDLTGYFKPKLGGRASVALAEGSGVGLAVGGLASRFAPYLEITTR